MSIFPIHSLTFAAKQVSEASNFIDNDMRL